MMSQEIHHKCKSLFLCAGGQAAVWVCRSLNEIMYDGLWEQLFNCSAWDKGDE